MADPKYIEKKEEFDTILKNGKTVIIDFTATWCGPCKTIAPKFKAMAAEFTDCEFYKVDVDDASDIAESEGISAMPTFRIYKGGSKVDELCGANEQKLRDLIVKHK